MLHLRDMGVKAGWGLFDDASHRTSRCLTKHEGKLPALTGHPSRFCELSIFAESSMSAASPAAALAEKVLAEVAAPSWQLSVC